MATTAGNIDKVCGSSVGKKGVGRKPPRCPWCGAVVCDKHRVRPDATPFIRADLLERGA